MRLRAILSFIGLQVGWFACVLGASRGHAWVGPVVVSVGLAVHVAKQPPARGARAREIVVLAVAALLGFVVDTTLLRTGVISATGERVAPPWLVALWPNLAAATASAGSLGSLSRRPILGALLGALAAPLAYDAGARLGAIGLGADRVGALAIVGLAWAPVLPSLFWLRRGHHVPIGERGASAVGLEPRDTTTKPQRSE